MSRLYHADFIALRGMALAITRNDLSAARPARLAARRSKDPHQARRLLALALEGASRTAAARAAGMDRQPLRDWVIRYSAEGVEGLCDRPRNFAVLVKEALPATARAKPLEIWFQDEARIGQKGTLTRVWGRVGSRPRAPRDTRYQWAYLFGAVCPEHATGAALVMPCVNREAMILHLEEISRAVAEGAHAILVLDGAGWHTSPALNVPDNITLLALPSCAQENDLRGERSPGEQQSHHVRSADGYLVSADSRRRHRRAA